MPAENQSQQSHLNDIQHLIDSAIELNLNFDIISGGKAQKYLDILYKKNVFFCAHPQINGANSILFEENETHFSLCMPNKPTYLFTQQNTGSLYDQNVIFIIENAQDIAKLLYNSIGAPEIYIYDPDMTYAIAVNWYNIHYIGNINLAEN